MLISLVTLLVYTSVSLRLAYAKRTINEKAKSLKNEAESHGWFSKWFPHVSKLAWSTIDLMNLYVSNSYLYNQRLRFG